MDNLILFDWLSATVKRQDTLEKNDYDSGYIFQSLLGMQDFSWQVFDGVKGFNKRIYFDGISIHTPSQKMPFVWLEMSGKGCRSFESYGHGNWFLLFKSLLDIGCNIKRIDIAHDDHSGILSMPQLIDDTLNELYISKARSHEVIIKMDDNTHERACSIYHGSENSNTLIRIYDKAKQLEIKAEHWIRTELQLRNENANNAVREILNNPDIGSIFSGIILRYLRYVEVDDSDINKWRWSMKEYWADLVKDAQPIAVASTPGVEYNICDLENFVFNQAGNAIKTYIDAFGIEQFLSKVKEYKPYITNPKYRKLLEDIQHV